MSQRDEDLTLLKRVIDWAAEQDEITNPRIEAAIEPFEQMQERLRRIESLRLTEPQRRWLKGIGALVLDEPEYENLWSRGVVPRGKDVPTPAVLQKLPLKPPQRRSGIDKTAEIQKATAEAAKATADASRSHDDALKAMWDHQPTAKAP